MRWAKKSKSNLSYIIYRQLYMVNTHKKKKLKLIYLIYSNSPEHVQEYKRNSLWFLNYKLKEQGRRWIPHTWDIEPCNMLAMVVVFAQPLMTSFSCLWSLRENRCILVHKLGYFCWRMHLSSSKFQREQNQKFSYALFGSLWYLNICIYIYR